MDQDVIIGWRAKRAGGRITIYGRNQAFEQVRVPHIDQIQCEGAGRVNAIDKDGKVWRLAGNEAHDFREKHPPVAAGA
jgi:hypothetical protein